MCQTDVEIGLESMPIEKGPGIQKLTATGAFIYVNTESYVFKETHLCKCRRYAIPQYNHSLHCL